ncbi:MAG: low molecular weight protein-tyrosine-phosphatase [Moraxellaceae bacterium]|nr:low molecular weight protein-tyrosine-phosphatase [Moraxellaceae bacterium]
MTTEPTRVLFVCLGNICRSPTVEQVFRDQAEKAGWAAQFVADSAGTGGFHAGEPPDRRAIRHARERGYDISGLRARQVGPADFERFDLILAMDALVLEGLQRIQKFSRGNRAELTLFLDFLPERKGQDVPDPYQGGPEGFEHVLDLAEQGSTALLRELLKRKGMFGCGC